MKQEIVWLRINKQAMETIKYVLQKTKQALDLNKNGKIDWWEIALLFGLAFIISALVNMLFY